MDNDEIEYEIIKGHIMNTDEISRNFEISHGAEAFIKVCCSSICKVLVDKNLCTKEDLQEALVESIEYMNNNNEDESYKDNINASMKEITQEESKAPVPETEEAPETEVGWLIEKTSEGQLTELCLGHSSDCNKTRWGSPDHAIRFARKEDGEAMAKFIFNHSFPPEYKVIEHSWG